MKNKLIAIFKILFSDNYAVFTYKNAPDWRYSDYVYADRYSWNCKEYEQYFFNMISETISNIKEAHKK